MLPQIGRNRANRHRRRRPDRSVHRDRAGSARPRGRRRRPRPRTAAPGEWQRRGVMQFHHAHTFRGQVVEALHDEMPDVLADLVAAGAGGDDAGAQRARRGAAVPPDDVRARDAAPRRRPNHAYARHRACRRGAGRAGPRRRRQVGRTWWPPIWSSTHPAGPAASPARCAAAVRALTVAPPTSLDSTGCGRAPNRARQLAHRPVAELSRLRGGGVPARQ